eukprot:1444835-Pyramimonas_sp.AAC.1
MPPKWLAFSRTTGVSKVFAAAESPEPDDDCPCLQEVDPLGPHGDQFVSRSHQFIDWIADRASLAQLVSKKKDTAPGPDGVPYSAWRVAGDIAIDTLHEAFLHLMSGNPQAPQQLNYCRAAFLPKGTIENGGAETRDAAHARMLSLSNSDNKILSSLVARPLNFVAADIVDGSQRGFVAGRSMIDNILEFDGSLWGWAHTLACKDSGGCLFDF